MALTFHESDDLQDYVKSKYYDNIFIGIPVGYTNLSMPFQLKVFSNSVLTTFTAEKIDISGNVCETLTLDNSLITHDTINGNFIHTGGVSFTVPLTTGIWQFKINDGIRIFTSDPFKVNNTVLAPVDGVIEYSDDNFISIGNNNLLKYTA